MTSEPRAFWLEDIGHKLLKNVTVHFGQTKVYDSTSEEAWLNAWRELTDPRYIAKFKIQKAWRSYLYKRPIKEALRTYRRTSMFRTELIYYPNVGYKYFEAFASFQSTKAPRKASPD